ncbi:ATP-binding protein [Candidatus Uhrbacteria bacterium]|nr:ATP-binding protein [Candidatus Uhrbacteria bacterium]
MNDRRRSSLGVVDGAGSAHSGPGAPHPELPAPRKLRRQWHPSTILWDMRNYTFEKWVSELIDNSFRDYGARSMRILVSRKKPASIVVIEDGIGMTCDRASAFLGIGRPEDGPRTTAGRTGRGFRYGAFGGTGCTRIQVHTISDEHADQVLCLDLSLAQFIQPPPRDGEDVPLIYQSREEAKFPLKKGTGTVFTLTEFDEPSVVFEGSDKPQIPPDEEIRELIGQQHPFYASKITVNGVICTPRKLDGEYIERTISTSAGDVQAVLWVLKKREPDLRLVFGPMGMAEFYRNLLQYEKRGRIPEDRRASKRFPAELLDPRVVGVILAPDLQWKFKTGGQSQFQDGVYRSKDLPGIVGEGLAELGHLITPHLAQADVGKETEDYQQYIKILAGALNTRFESPSGVAPGGNAPPHAGDGSPESPVPAAIRMVPAYRELETGGDMELFTLENVPPDASVHWSVSAPGAGKLQVDVVSADARDRGVRHATLETGNRPGSFEVRAMIDGRGDEVWAATVVLRLPLSRGAAEHRNLVIRPSKKTVAPGDSFYVRILERDSGKVSDCFFDWLESDPDVLSVQQIGKSSTAKVTALALGTARIVARERREDGAEGFQLSGNYEVRNEEGSRDGVQQGGGQTGGNGQHHSSVDIHIRLKDRSYILRIIRAGGVQSMYRHAQLGTGIPIIDADVEYPPLRSAKPPHAFVRELLRILVSAYVRDEAMAHPNLTTDELIELSDRVLAEATDRNQL